MSNQARDTKPLESQNVAPSVDGDDVVDYNISESEAHSSDSSIPPVVRNLEIVHRTGVSTIATRGWQDTTALHKEASTRGRNPKVSLTDVLLNAEHSRMYHEIATSKSKNGRANGHGRISSSWDSLCGVMGTSSSLVAFQNKRTQLKRLTYTSITTFHKELIIYRNKLRDPVDVKMLDEDWALRLVRDPAASAMRGNWKSSASSLTKEQKEKKKRRRKLGRSPLHTSGMAKKKKKKERVESSLGLASISSRLLIKEFTLPWSECVRIV